MGLVHTRRAGRCIEYQCAPGLVRLEQHNGQLTLTVSRPSGATVTLAATMPGSDPSPEQQIPAAPTPDTADAAPTSKS